MADFKLPASVLAALGILTNPACMPCLKVGDDTAETTSSACLSVTACLDTTTGPCLDTTTGPCLSPIDSGDTGDTGDTGDSGDTDSGDTDSGDTDSGDTGDTDSGDTGDTASDTGAIVVEARHGASLVASVTSGGRGAVGRTGKLAHAALDAVLERGVLPEDLAARLRR